MVAEGGGWFLVKLSEGSCGLGGPCSRLVDHIRHEHKNGEYFRRK